MSDLENHFSRFRRNIVGIDQAFKTPYGEQRIIYADWTASGRLYAPIERKIPEVFGPFVGNTHSESSITGTSMTIAYHEAQSIIKRHVNAGEKDSIITAGFGMTAAVNKFQRILGLRIPERLQARVTLAENNRPVVFITHMEHHSNHTSWLETIAEVVCLEADDRGLVDVDSLRRLLAKYEKREMKIGSFSACSNVSGICPPYFELAKIMHEHGGYCFVDFAASAPYTAIDMHPPDPGQKLDAIFFSPHKFLGGPGTSGVLLFDSDLYHNRVPDHPGGGTVDWTNPWGNHSFVKDIEAREDGGTPGFLQAIKTALCIQLKQEMGPDKMLARERELLRIAFSEMRKIPTLHILADHIEDRLGIISFYVDDLHYNLMVKLLNDRFGIQVRGGCSCAGTYGHYLLHVDPATSKHITDMIDQGDLSAKPGWVRMSLHPTMTDEELRFVLQAIRDIVENIDLWSQDYVYSNTKNEYFSTIEDGWETPSPASWFRLED